MMTEIQEIFKTMENPLSNPCVYCGLVDRHPGQHPKIAAFGLERGHNWVSIFHVPRSGKTPSLGEPTGVWGQL
jgi:hypothetical protein